MKSLSRIVTALVLSSLLAACSSVSSKYPVGEPVDDETLAQYDGVWQTSDGILYIKSLKDGRAKAGWLEWEDDEFQLTQIDLVVADVGDARFLNMVEPREETLGDDEDAAADSDDDKPAYYFFRLMFDDDGAVVLYPPQSDVFKSAVRDGTLDGQIKGNTHSSDVHITSLKEALEKFLDSEKVGTQFDMESPLILMRLHSLE